MTPTLIVLALVALGVGIVVWATRKRPGPPPSQQMDQDTGWNDTVHRADETPPRPDSRP